MHGVLGTSQWRYLMTVYKPSSMAGHLNLRKLPSSHADGRGCPHLIMSCPERWTTSVRNAREIQGAQVEMQVWLSFT